MLDRREMIAATLAGVAGDSEDALRIHALEALTRRSGRRGDLALVRNLDRPGPYVDEPHPFHLVLQRLEEGPLDPTAQGALARTTKTMMLDEDWREASR